MNQIKSQLQRTLSIQSLTAEPLDLLVLGGGIVGSGIARDAAMRGLRTGLVEQHDFAFGTSSRSSRLLHGGIRYLAQGRIGLVREASVEKQILHRIAPHLVQPLAFLFPTYRDSDWPLWQLRIGVKIYDLLCGGRNFKPSMSLNRNETLTQAPQLRAEQLTGAVQYFDAFTNDARLVLDTLRSAAKAGATVLNYCRFDDARRESDLWRCEVEDRLTGQTHSLRARTVVNATGPWADGLPHSHVKLRLTKGIHLVMDHRRLPVPNAVVMTVAKRILFAIPWGERVILGTTDTDYRGPLESVHADRDDIDHVLRVVNQFFPTARIDPEDIMGTWAGLRPLLANANGGPSDISRSHEIRNPEPGWWDVAGGKLTTYRLMAEQTMDRIVKALKPINRYKECRTGTEPLLPSEETKNLSGILPPEFNRHAVEHFCVNEWAVHLDDVMIRRTGWHYYYSDAAEKATQAAEWMGDLMSWTPAQRAEELNRYRDVSSQPNRESTLSAQSE